MRETHTYKKRSVSFQGTYGKFGALEYLDHMLDDGRLSEDESTVVGKVLQKINSMCTAIDANYKDDKFRRWCANNMRSEIKGHIDALEADNAFGEHKVYDLLNNYLTAKHRTLNGLAQKTRRPLPARTSGEGVSKQEPSIDNGDLEYKFMAHCFVALGASLLNEQFLSSDMKFFVFERMYRNLGAMGYDEEQVNKAKTTAMKLAEKFGTTNEFMG